MQFSNILFSIESLVPVETLCGYLDPGTGSFALQLLLAGAFGGLFVLKQSWQQCRTWLTQVLAGRPKPTKLERAD